MNSQIKRKMKMENLKEIELVSATVTLSYKGVNEEGTRVMLTEEMTPNPAWTAVLMRYLHHHQKVDRHCLGSRKISLQGSCGDYPAVEARRWNPALPFNG
jgi:hypothetical protein